MPSASAAAAMVFAVYIPAHEPSVGQACRSISSSSSCVIRPSAQALAAGHRQGGYQGCWGGLGAHFAVAGD